MSENTNNIRIVQTRSSIDCSERQKRTLRALGLRKINQVVELPKNAAVEGMIRKVEHLVKVELN